MRRAVLRALSAVFCCVCLPIAFTGCGSNGGTCVDCVKMAPAYLLAVSEQSLQSGQLLSFPADVTTGKLGAPLAIASPLPPFSSITVAGETPQYLYLAPLNALPAFPAQVYGYSVDKATGALTQLPSSPYPVPNAIALNVETGSGPFLYVGGTSILTGGLAPTVNAFSVGSDGSLSPSIPGSPYAAAPATNSLAGAGPSLSGPWPYLYATEYEGSTGTAGGVAGYSIDNSGVLTELPGSPFLTPANGSPEAVVYDPMGYVYVTLFNPVRTGPQWSLAGFAVDQSTGALTPVPGSPFAISGSGALTLDPTGQFLFTGIDDTQTIVEYQVNRANGTISPLSGLSAHVDRPFFVWGQYLYASSDGADGKMDAIAGFSIDESTGVLTPVPGSPFAAGAPVVAMTSISFPL